MISTVRWQYGQSATLAPGMTGTTRIVPLHRRRSVEGGTDPYSITGLHSLACAALAGSRRAEGRRNQPGMRRPGGDALFGVDEGDHVGDQVMPAVPEVLPFAIEGQDDEGGVPERALDLDLHRVRSAGTREGAEGAVRSRSGRFHAAAVERKQAPSGAAVAGAG